MELQGKTFLILGGSGLVGRAVARRLLDFRPRRIVLAALFENEVRTGAECFERGGARSLKSEPRS